MVRKILVAQALDVGVVGPGGVQPEDGLGPGRLGSCHGKFDPVLDGSVLGLKM